MQTGYFLENTGADTDENERKGNDEKRTFSKNSINFGKILQILQHLQNFAEISRKLLIFQTDFFLNFWDCSCAKVCKSCRAWKMLSNAYFLAQFRFDTAENEPAKNWDDTPKFWRVIPWQQKLAGEGARGGQVPLHLQAAGAPAALPRVERPASRAAHERTP